MSDNCEHTNPLKHQGSSQGERLLSALLPENVELHGLKEADWLKFAYDYAQLINYYPSDDPGNTRGDWQSFFESSDDVTSLLNRYGEGDIEPHMALFISFLKLLTYSQTSLNGIPKRHLDFYYKEVLELENRSFEPDHVHVLFELAKNAKDELIDKDISLNAGKDSDGNPLHYQTVNSLVVNPAKIASLKSVFVDKSEGGKQILRHAPMTNSKDGIEEELDEGESWRAFGNSSWPKADLGFYISSPLLRMEEGFRVIRLKFKLSKLPDIEKINYRAFITTEKEWLNIPVTDVIKSDRDFNLILELEVTSDLDPIVSYNEEVHAEGLPVTDPVLKIQFVKPAEEVGEWTPVDYHLLSERTIQMLELEAEADLTEALQLQNELGNVDPSKPFMPFGSRPKVGSKLEIISEEIINKPISRIQIGMIWLNMPSNFSEHYEHYLNGIGKQKQLDFSNSGLQGNYNSYTQYKNEIILGNELNEIKDLISEFGSNGDSSDEPETKTDNMKDDFKLQIESPYNSGTQAYELFKDLPQVTITPSGESISSPKGEINMILTSSFYHDLYTELYVKAVLDAQNPPIMRDDDDEIILDLPNEPYTPLLDQLILTYTAKETIAFSKEEEKESSSVMFHRHPFGTKKVSSDIKTLVPNYQNNELYIGLEAMKAGSNISMLFQVAEGSENPNHSSFEKEDIDWWVLSDNDWMKIESSDFARNQTNNFLRSGIVEIPVSKQATRENTLLDKELHWLKVRLKKEEDAVSQFINVHAQASEAIFFDQQNSTDHLEDGLPPESIGQLVHPRAQIKSVSQPYASFDGKPAESDHSFYRRVSERLRHKDRAVSIWDYEHLVLEEFPSLYKVKCLNHTHWNGTTLDEMSPGDVTLVLIPKITESNTDFRLKPMVSQDFRDRVEEYVSQKNSMHARIKSANAIYELVRFEFKIRFYTGYDFNFYQGQTIEDLKRLLAPWVFESDAAIEFGGSFSEYQIVNYLENLEYVDFIADFAMFHQPLNSGDFIRKTVIEPSNPMAILVPVENHDIDEAETC